MLVLPYDASLHLVLNHRLARQRRFEPDHWFDPCRGFGGAAIAPAPVVQPGAPPIRRQCLPEWGKPLHARTWKERAPVPIELEPRQPLQDRVNRRLGRAVSV